MNGDGTGFQNGELIEDTTNMVGTYPEEYQQIFDHCEDMEFRLYTCLKYPRRCR